MEILRRKIYMYLGWKNIMRDMEIIEFCLGDAMMQNKCSFSLTQILKIQLKMKESMFFR